MFSSQPATSSPSKVLKRVTAACERCRKQKIRCSGSSPCDACTKRNLICWFNDSHQKVTVTKGYIEDLRRKVSQSRDANPLPSPDDSVRPSILNIDENTSLSAQDSSCSTAASTPGTKQAPPMPNLLATAQSTFMTAGDGMTFYLGASSNWSFTQKILDMVYERASQAGPAEWQRVDSIAAAYDLAWDGLPIRSEPSSPALPTLDHALYLINAVKFHCGQLFHIFDEITFMSALHTFYQNPSDHQVADQLWMTHFMIVLAFGKAFTNKKNTGKTPPGAEYLYHALQILPSMVMLWRRPVHSVEVMTCFALYLHCLDYRIVAHNFAGQAMRLALNQGLHTDMPTDRLGDAWVERSRRAWWTVYILDREMTTIAGLPQSIQDDDVQSKLPTFSGSVQRTTTLKMQIKLSQMVGNISRTVYAVDGRLHRAFPTSTKRALAEIASVADELHQWFPISLEQKCQGISRASAHLHLKHHRGIILATRPLLYGFLKIWLECQEDCHARLASSHTASNIIQMCLDSSMQILLILESLQEQSLLDHFLPFDLDSVAAATINVVVSLALNHTLIDNGPRWMALAYTILDELVAGGNQVAVLRKAELMELAEMLGNLASTTETLATRLPAHPPLFPLNHLPTNSSESVMSDFSMSPNFDKVPGELFTAADILDLANSIDSMDADWVYQSIGSYGIW